MKIDYGSRLDEAKSLADIFEVVKSLVLNSTGKCRGGLMLGMANLGNHPQGFFGGFFTTGSNVIVLNKIPLQRIKETRPELYKPYVFHVLLHEYIHSLSYLDEAEVRSPVFTEPAVSIARPVARVASRSKSNTPSAVFRGNGLTRRFCLSIGEATGASKIACIGCATYPSAKTNAKWKRGMGRRI